LTGRRCGNLLDAIVDVQELKKSFKNRLAVNNVSFAIAVQLYDSNQKTAAGQGLFL